MYHIGNVGDSKNMKDLGSLCSLFHEPKASLREFMFLSNAMLELYKRYCIKLQKVTHAIGFLTSLGRIL